ncbi:MAG: glucosaminidase domain-containing protein, partial [Peptococcaceae bacterium]|nr:glucosaminidase domain-containing protein [Peptococcaceae bacterium]
DQSDDEEEALASVWHGLSIQGESIATARELKAFLAEKEPVIREMMETRYPDLGFTPFPEDIVDLYLEIGARYNIRGDLAFAQALKETGYFQFYGIVKPFQNNFCGLGATGAKNTGEEPLNGVDPGRAMYIPGLHGIMFMSVADGVEAHIQHLYAYTTNKKLPAGCELVDPRFNYVKRGVAERWIDLNGRWAVPGNGYGESLIDDYWMPAVEDRLQELE